MTNVSFARWSAVLVAALICACGARSPQGAAVARQMPAASSADTTAAAHAGLTPAQARRLAALAAPVAVPGYVPGGFAVAAVRARPGGARGPARRASYRIRYDAPGGACFTIEMAAGGLGGPAPPEENRRAVDPSLFPSPAGQAYHVFWTEANPEWPLPPRSLFSSWLEHERRFYRLTSGHIVGQGCRRLAPAAAVRVVESLHWLEGTAAQADPSDVLDLSFDLGAYDPAAWEPYRMNRPFAIRSDTGASPRAAALHVLDALDLRAGPDASETVRTARPAPRATVVLATHLGLRDDSVAGARYRVELSRAEGRWVLRRLGMQYRCQPGRGHRDWSKQRCL